jgi:putative FmdB family regulatory protein
MSCYVYKCPKCGEFERLEPINSERLKKCPTCDNEVKLKIYPSHTIFKGDGWSGKNDLKGILE